MKTAALVILLFGLPVVAGQAKEPRATVTKSAIHGRPDLVPLLHHPMDGQLAVKNIGTGQAGPSKLTLDCERQESPAAMHSCPNLPVSFMETYFDPAFPENATVQVPALAPGATFKHTLTFWNTFKWPSGTYKFTVVADAGGRRTKNSIAVSTLTVR